MAEIVSLKWEVVIMRKEKRKHIRYQNIIFYLLIMKKSIILEKIDSSLGN